MCPTREHAPHSALGARAWALATGPGAFVHAGLAGVPVGFNWAGLEARAGRRLSAPLRGLLAAVERGALTGLAERRAAEADERG